MYHYKNSNSQWKNEVFVLWEQQQKHTNYYTGKERSIQTNNRILQNMQNNFCGGNINGTAC
jgi:hypothetical protein